MRCSRFYCYFNLEVITKMSCRFTIYSVLDVTAQVSKREVFLQMFNKQNIILLIYKFACLPLSI